MLWKTGSTQFFLFERRKMKMKKTGMISILTKVPVLKLPDFYVFRVLIEVTIVTSWKTTIPRGVTRRSKIVQAHVDF